MLERTGDHRGGAVHAIDWALDGTEWVPCLVVGFLALATVAHAEVPKIVNLDAPGTLETLKRDNPDHFRRVVGVVEAAAKTSCRSPRFGALVRASFGVKNVGCGGLLIQTVYPAKGDLAFEIGTVTYTVGVTILPEEKLIPAKDAD